MDPYETKISDVLASQNFLQKHPGNSQLGSDVYSSAVNSSSEIIQRQRYSGQYVSNANQLNFGSQSSFFITPGSVMNGIMISASVALPQYARAPDLWLLEAISSVELVISGSSSVQSLKINGRSHMEMVLATLNSNKVQGLKQACPFQNLAGGGATVNASVPLHLFFSSADIMALFPLDTSTLQSQIIINIRWKQNYEIFSGDATNAVTLPNAFSNLYLRVADQVQISNDFALANQLRQDPSLVYSIPGTYLQSYSEVVNVGSFSTEQQVTLTSMPSGNLQAILCSIREVAKEGSSGTQTLISPYARFSSIRCLYNGIELFRADTPEELALMNCIMTDRDSGVLVNPRSITDNAAGGSGNVGSLQHPPVIIMPFSNEVSKVLRDRRHEHTKDYSGSSIQFYFTVTENVEYYSDTFPITAGDFLAHSTGDYRVNFTFVNNALYEISQRTVALEM